MKSTTVLAAAAAILISGEIAHALTPAKDNFTTNTIDKKLWIPKNYSKGKLQNTNKRMEFIVSGKPTGDDFATLTLKNNQPGYNENWEIILDVKNTLSKGEQVGTGILILNAADTRDNASLEFYGKGNLGGFNTIGVTNDKDNLANDIRSNPRVSAGSMRVTFSKATKILTFWHDANGPTNGYVWKRISTFSTNGVGGNRRGNWQMNPGGGRFIIRLFGYSDGSAVKAGQVNFDNFKLRNLR